MTVLSGALYSDKAGTAGILKIDENSYNNFKTVLQLIKPLFLWCVIENIKLNLHVKISVI